MLLDIRLAVRVLSRHLAASGAIVLLVAFSIAINTTLFSVIDGLLFRPLPFADADCLVVVGKPRAGSDRPGPLSPALWRDVQDTPRFAAVCAMAPGLAADGRSEQPDEGIREERVSATFFKVLGTAPIAGRTLGPAAQDYAADTGVISYDLWRARFGSDAGVVGRAMSVSGRRVVVVGVMPPDFDFPRGTNLWTPLSFASNLPDDQYYYLQVVARLPARPTSRVIAGVPNGMVGQRLREFVRPNGTLALGFLLVATALILLVTWVQIAGLQLTRAMDRVREIGVRTALGAGRWALVRQFATEGAVLSGLALALAWVGTPTLTALVMRLLPPEMTRGQHVAADPRTLAFACAMAVAGTIVFALAPLGVILGSRPSDALRGTSRTLPSARAGRARRVLLVGQLAVTVALLYLAGLTLHSFIAVSRIDLGFVPHGLLAISIPSAQPGVTGLERRRQDFQAAADAVRGVPGVQDVAGATTRPLRGEKVTVPVSSGGPGPGSRALWVSVTPGFFRTAGMTVRQGRDLGDTGQNEVVVSRLLAAQLSTDGPLVGRTIRLAGFPVRVVGVVNEVPPGYPDEPPEAQIFASAARFMPPSFLYVRAAHLSPELVAAVCRRVQVTLGLAHSPDVTDFTSEALRATSPQRSRSMLLGFLGLSGLLLLSVGLYGAISHATGRRTREFALRIALGADPAEVQRGVLLSTTGLVAAGTFVGLAVGVGLARWGAALLYGVTAADLPTVVCVVVLLVLTGLGAALTPARRAARVQPAQALREQ